MKEIEESILTGYPNVISYECTKKIIEQMEKYICKIKIGQKQGTGFFCKIPFPDKNHMLPVFITNYHVINEQELLILFSLLSFSNKMHALHFLFEHTCPQFSHVKQSLFFTFSSILKNSPE